MRGTLSWLLLTLIFVGCAEPEPQPRVRDITVDSVRVLRSTEPPSAVGHAVVGGTVGMLLFGPIGAAAGAAIAGGSATSVEACRVDGHDSEGTVSITANHKSSLEACALLRRGDTVLIVRHGNGWRLL